LYLKGRFYWNKRTRDGFEKAAGFFQQAIDKDPSYALAYAGLADVYMLMGAYLFIPPNESAAKARAAATKAIEIDESLAEPHTTLASLYEGYEWNWSAAEREYKRALELNPNYAVAYQWYGEFLTVQNHADQGLALMLKSIELDPLSPVHYVAVSEASGALRQYDEAIKQLNKALEIDPKFPRALSALGMAYCWKGQPKEAVEIIQQSLLYSDSSVEYLAQLGYVEGRMGRTKEARRILDDLLSRSMRGYLPPFLIGEVYIGLNETDSAFEWLNRAADERSNNLEYLIVDPMFDPIRNDPRFAELIEKVGLPL